MKSPHIELRPGSIWIDGEPVILFSSSLFYFRIPKEEWRSRMKTLVRLGYNTIDVYFPWNFHEMEPGVWDFQGQRDVAAFLRMAKEEGLWVIARPGPYICSEWDGGALPAYLIADPDIRLRDADPYYLQAVRRWFSHILPSIVDFQIDNGGSIILVQIENELDFFDCQDRPGMMGALRDMALEYGITVPLIACSGQGDIARATGGIEGVVPTCNIYFDERDSRIEERVRHYARILEERGYPLCIVETNRSHTDLRRLIISGAKLVGPYLQVGGSNFGFTTSVNNWGSPMAFMTSHYDFGGMISPGGVVRPDGMEARLLTRTLEALGPAAALAKPVNEVPVNIIGAVVSSAIELEGGGWIISLANPGDEASQVSLGEGSGRFPCKTKLEIAPKHSPFVLWELPLTAWGVDGQVVYAIGELVGRERREDGLELTFVASGSVEIALRIPDAVLCKSSGWEVEKVGDIWLLWIEDVQAASAEFCLSENQHVIIGAVDRETAAGFSISTINSIKTGKLPESNLTWQFEALDPCTEHWFAAARDCETQLHLERNGIYRGYGWYRSTGSVQGPKGLLVRSAGDVLSFYSGSRYLGNLVPGGQDSYLPLQSGLSFGPESPLIVKAEIWGHSNFDDGRLPALRLKSLRGIGTVTAVSEVTNLTATWFYQDNARYPMEVIDSSWPYLYFGGWSTSKEPAPGVYYRTVRFNNDGDTRILYFPGLQVNARVYVNQAPVGEVTPFNPWMDLSSNSRPGETIQLALFVDRQLRLAAGQVILYQGQTISHWEVAGWGEADFTYLMNRSPGESAATDLPFKLESGKMGWLHAQIPESIASTAALDLVFEGKELKISVWLGDRLVGRVWLPSRKCPRMAGGPDNCVYLPADWIQAANRKIHLLIESVDELKCGELTKANIVLES